MHFTSEKPYFVCLGRFQYKYCTVTEQYYNILKFELLLTFGGTPKL